MLDFAFGVGWLPHSRRIRYPMHNWLSKCFVYLKDYVGGCTTLSSLRIWWQNSSIFVGTAQTTIIQTLKNLLDMKWVPKNRILEIHEYLFITQNLQVYTPSHSRYFGLLQLMQCTSNGGTPTTLKNNSMKHYKMPKFVVRSSKCRLTIEDAAELCLKSVRTVKRGIREKPFHRSVEG